MIVGHGIDLMSTSRIETSIARFGEHFLARIYTDYERAVADRRVKLSSQMYTAYWAAKEAELPENVDPNDPEFDSPETHARMDRLLEGDISAPAGFVLPIRRWQSKSSDARWRSEHWTFRRGRLFLVPGDSAAGFRLPLASLPEIPEEDYPYIYPEDPSIPRDPLPSREQIEDALPVARASSTGLTERQQNTEQDKKHSAVRTALTIEPRDSVLRVFMPPRRAP